MNGSISPTPDESHHRLKKSGWSIGYVSFGPLWLVSGTNGENVIQAYGKSLDEAYWRACEQAREVGMLGSAPTKDQGGRLQ